MKLWNGRFNENTNELTDMYNASISFDIKLLRYDVKASIAHAKGLVNAGIINESEYQQISAGLQKIDERFCKNQIDFNAGDEDVHMLIERLLIEQIGDIGKKVHTARSRNDQVATATRLYAVDQLQNVSKQLSQWIETLAQLSRDYKDDIMPGCTHLQAAQPITLGFWFDAYMQMFIRDLQKIKSSLKIMDYCPLGSAALAGSSFPIDRHLVADELNFCAPTLNSMDSVADRDYIVDCLYNLSLIGIHFSKMAEEIIIFNSQVYNYINLSDQYSTGSSIMPQKKNPDIAELARGKSARLIGNLTQMLTLLKATGLAYNKDFQEDKESLFDSFDTILMTLAVFPPMLTTATFNTTKMREDTEYGFINATDFADYLVNHSIPFRDAHHIVGTLVKYAEENNLKLTEIPLEVMQSVCPNINNDVYQYINLDNCLKRKTTYGAPAWFIANN